MSVNEWAEHGTPRLRSRWRDGRTEVEDMEGDPLFSVHGHLTHKQIEEINRLIARAEARAEQLGRASLARDLLQILGCAPVERIDALDEKVGELGNELRQRIGKIERA